ncbi:unnamed protein product [Discosporangium mesarthrocarpum]
MTGDRQHGLRRTCTVQLTTDSKRDNEVASISIPTLLWLPQIGKQVNGREVPGRGGDTTIFFVLGRQPKGQFPPGWDLSLVGMCVGEQRTVSIPPLVGYGASGMALRGVPAGATLLYNVKLIGVNGVNMCATQ